MEKLQGYKINTQFFDTPLQLGGIRLVQAGRFFCNGDTLIMPHLHKEFLELTIVTDGKGYISTNGVQIPVVKNDIYVSFPFDSHGISSDKNEPLQYDHLAFIVDEPEYLQAIQDIIARFYQPECRIIQDSRINYLTYCILGEFSKDRKLKNSLIENTVHNILIYLIRAFDKKETVNSLEHATEKEAFCNRIMNYIDTNIYSLENLRDISKIAGYNYNYISSVFSKTTGITLREYYTNRKLEVANMLLYEGKLKVCQIAERLHYSNGNALTKAYKKKYGIPPKKN